MAEKIVVHPNSADLIEQLENLKSGGGGGTFDSMEARVKRLEDDVSDLKSDMKAVRSDLSYIKGRLDQMPTTVQLIGFAIAVFLASGLMRFVLG